MVARDWFWIILCGAIWGCSFLFNAVLLREIGPLWIAGGRVGIAAAASWLVLLALRKKLPRDPVLIVKLGLLGIFAYALPFSLFPVGQGHIPSGLTAIINALTPITTVVISHFWRGGERATVNKSLGVMAGFAGAAMLAVPALASGGEAQLWAIVVCFVATVVYAMSLNITRSFRGVEPTMLATIALTGAAVCTVPVALVVEGLPQVTRIETWGAWFGLGLLSTALTFQIMYRILPRVGATNFASNTFISPVVAIVLGIALLGETVHPEYLLGMAAIFVGLLLIDGRVVKAWRARMV